MTYAKLDNPCQLTEPLEQRFPVNWCHIIRFANYGI